jgi:hypothetical protein
MLIASLDLAHHGIFDAQSRVTNLEGAFAVLANATGYKLSHISLLV